MNVIGEHSSGFDGESATWKKANERVTDEFFEPWKIVDSTRRRHWFNGNPIRISDNQQDVNWVGCRPRVTIGLGCSEGKSNLDHGTTVV